MTTKINVFIPSSVHFFPLTLEMGRIAGCGCFMQPIVDHNFL